MAFSDTLVHRNGSTVATSTGSISLLNFLSVVFDIGFFFLESYNQTRHFLVLCSRNTMVATSAGIIKCPILADVFNIVPNNWNYFFMGHGIPNMV
jgi:hypothetical protein